MKKNHIYTSSDSVMMDNNKNKKNKKKKTIHRTKIR